MDARTARKLFKDYLTAKRAAGESTKGLTYGTLVEKLSQQSGKLHEKHTGATFKFEVATVEGRVRLRAKRS